jgi:hypothetical protein
MVTGLLLLKDEDWMGFEQVVHKQVHLDDISLLYQMDKFSWHIQCYLWQVHSDLFLAGGPMHG